MISVEETVRTYLECLSMSFADKSPEEQKKIQEILKKSAVDLCYTLVPEVDVLVSERGIFNPESQEKAAVMKAFFNAQRTAFFAIISGISAVKEQMTRQEAQLQSNIQDIKKQLDKMETRINGVVQLRNTSMGATIKTTPTKVQK